MGVAKIQMDWVGLADMHMLSDASRVLKSVISKLQQVRKVFVKSTLHLLKYFSKVFRNYKIKITFRKLF